MRALVVALTASLALAARAEVPFPARSGESGLLDVPDAKVVGAGSLLLGAELRFDKPSSSPANTGPLPVYAVAGFTERLDVGMSMREWGQPGDPVPARMAYGTAMKLQLFDDEKGPSIALGLNLDRLNTDPVGGGRVIASAQPVPEVQLAGFIGGEHGFSRAAGSGLTFGGALAFSFMRGFTAILEGLDGPRGDNLGGAVRWSARPSLAFQLGINYLPQDRGFRVSLGVAFLPPPRARPAEASPALGSGVAPEPARAPSGFADPRPRFRLLMAMSGPQRLAESRRLQYGPYVPRTAVADAPVAAPGPKAAAPSLEDLADAQLRDQEALAEARERRVRATADQLDTREKAALEEAKNAEARERELASREQQLDARERRIASPGARTEQQRQLPSLEAQLGAQERQLLSQERSFGPAVDAALGRERDASAHEEAERQEANRLATSLGAAPSRAQQLELRKQTLAAKSRQRAAIEARLVARGERIDALERQLRTKSGRLDLWSRRLDARTERLDLLEKHAVETRPAPAPPTPRDAKEPAPKDKSVFVMVVKSPTAIMKERAAQTAPAAASTLHTGVAVEKAVAAATVVTFPTPASQISELDRETIDNIAKLAAKDHCELLIWARAKDPTAMAEAQRRAEEIRTRTQAVGPLEKSQVVTRITMRPGAQGIDVVVSALRETAKPAETPASAPAPTGPALQAGETGKRQVREAVVAAQPSIEVCVGDHLQQNRLQHAEGILKLTLSQQGKVTKVSTTGADLAGAELESCLTAASGGWKFPSAEADYVVDVPITVIRGGAAR